MTYRRNYYGRPRPRLHLVDAADVGRFVTLKIRNGQPGGAPLYVSGIVTAVTAAAVTISREVHPTGPWDKWETYTTDSAIAHRRILSRS
jgi:hypothetical protein